MRKRQLFAEILHIVPMHMLIHSIKNTTTTQRSPRAQSGCMGSPRNGERRADFPAFWPQLYQFDQPEGRRYTILKASSMARMYHSAAGLTRDGKVLMGGCTACGTAIISSYVDGWTESQRGVSAEHHIMHSTTSGHLLLTCAL